MADVPAACAVPAFLVVVVSLSSFPMSATGDVVKVFFLQSNSIVHKLLMKDSDIGMQFCGARPEGHRCLL